jgi:hydrogenase expression/formation protein HypD
LLAARAHGADVRIVYSPIDAVSLARQHPDRHWVFFAVGFETTAPATALAVRQAQALELRNFSLLVAHVRVLPAMRAIMEDERTQVEGFLAAGHVCTVDGYQDYHAFVDRYRCPVVVTGFEPVDLLCGILACVRQLENSRAEVENYYRRTVTADGNRHAKSLIDDVYEVCPRSWRGIGSLADGGLQLRPQWAAFDASQFSRGGSNPRSASSSASSARR